MKKTIAKIENFLFDSWYGIFIWVSVVVIFVEITKLYLVGITLLFLPPLAFSLYHKIFDKTN